MNHNTKNAKIAAISAALKGKFPYSLPEYLKFPDFEFSVKIGKLSTFIGPISTTVHFFVDKIFIFPLGRHHFLCYNYLS